MGRALIRLGGLLIVAAVVYLAAAQVLAGRPDTILFRNIAAAGAACVVVGFVVSATGRGMAAIVGRSCPRCGRRVARGRVYCDDHLQETINEYRDQNRNKGA
jgi:hypothetical protein